MIASSMATLSGPEPAGLATPSRSGHGRSAGSPNCAVWSCVLSLSIRILKRKQMNRSCIFSSSHCMVVFTFRITKGFNRPSQVDSVWSDAGRPRRRSRSTNVTARASGVARRAASFRLSSAVAVLYSYEKNFENIFWKWFFCFHVVSDSDYESNLKFEFVKFDLCLCSANSAFKFLTFYLEIVPCRPVSSDCPKLRLARLLVPLALRYYYLSRPSRPGSPQVAAPFLCIECIEFQQPVRLWLWRLRWRSRPGPGSGAGDRSWPRVQAWLTHIQVRSCTLNWPTLCAVFKLQYKIMTNSKFCQWVNLSVKPVNYPSPLQVGKLKENLNSLADSRMCTKSWLTFTRTWTYHIIS